MEPMVERRIGRLSRLEWQEMGIYGAGERGDAAAVSVLVQDCGPLVGGQEREAAWLAGYLSRTVKVAIERTYPAGTAVPLGWL